MTARREMTTDRERALKEALRRLAEELAAERQRREDCEAALRHFTGGIGYPYKPAHDYFARHSSSGNEAG